MSADSAVTYTSVHSEARSWSIPSEDPYEEAARQLLEQAPHSPEYVPDPMELEDHVPVYILEPEHSEDLVPAEDEAPTPLLPSFLYAMSAYSYLPYQPYIIYLYKLSFAPSDEEVEGPLKDQPLSVDASPTTLSPGYIADSDPEEDKEDPKEDPADHPADR
ncbi:hypothetical protein Tco_0652165 [Tanacetum coccineum]|uniref:Uncharacterized protein n=1 Tax=Tanacetum coccineum TaxID=301880 RepID=A0ABQ4WWS9_9ASTR